jgi:hypothetical protein
MARHGSRERARYAFDRFMARGTGALIAGLFGLSALLVLSIAALLIVSDAVRGANGNPSLGFLYAVWMSVLRTLDPGTMGTDQGQPAFVIAMFGVTLGGIFIVATLIGIISTGLEARLARLRTGHSPVVEQSHVVVLGWSNAIFTVVDQLARAASERRRRGALVILAERDKVAMEEEIRSSTPMVPPSTWTRPAGTCISIAP